MAIRNLGILDWWGGQSKDYHRNYWVKFLIETDDYLDGPDRIIGQAPGLPAIGAAWTYGNDNDPYALCHPNVDCTSVVKNERNFHWHIKFDFSTKPWATCTSQPKQNPLTEPDQISGSFVNYQERVAKDTNNKAIMSSSLEPIWVNKDSDRPTVSIQQTVGTLGLSTFSAMINTLNDAPLWGLPARNIKLRNVPWRRLVWGICAFYYQRTLQFDIDYSSFDLYDVLDQGHRWVDPDKLAQQGVGLNRNDPANFTRAVDSAGNVQKIVLLDGNGEINNDPVNNPVYIAPVQLYGESNFLSLGIPTSL